MLSYKQPLGDGLLRTHLLCTFPKTKREGVVHTPPLLQSKADIFFSESSHIVLEELAPWETHYPDLHEIVEAIQNEFGLKVYQT